MVKLRGGAGAEVTHGPDTKKQHDKGGKGRAKGIDKGWMPSGCAAGAPATTNTRIVTAAAAAAAHRMLPVSYSAIAPGRCYSLIMPHFVGLYRIAIAVGELLSVLQGPKFLGGNVAVSLNARAMYCMYIMAPATWQLWSLSPSLFISPSSSLHSESKSNNGRLYAIETGQGPARPEAKNTPLSCTAVVTPHITSAVHIGWFVVHSIPDYMRTEKLLQCA